jgi:hypothetical protein
MMKRPAPISLRIRANEATARARQLLREFDEKENLQRRVRWQAMKAVVAIREMRAAAAPKLRTMSSSDSKRWLAEVESIESKLLRISRRDVG